MYEVYWVILAAQVQPQLQNVCDCVSQVSLQPLLCSSINLEQMILKLWIYFFLWQWEQWFWRACPFIFQRSCSWMLLCGIFQWFTRNKSCLFLLDRPRTYAAKKIELSRQFWNYRALISCRCNEPVSSVYSTYEVTTEDSCWDATPIPFSFEYMENLECSESSVQSFMVVGYNLWGVVLLTSVVKSSKYQDFFLPFKRELIFLPLIFIWAFIQTIPCCVGVFKVLK